MSVTSMTLSPQELRCVNKTVSFLDETKGGTWKLPDGPTLDELHPSEPSPEVIITNGKLEAAVEVKQLTGDAMQQAYGASLLSLEQSLIPSCGGYYAVTPPFDVQLPFDKKLVRKLKQEIERVAPTLSPNENGALIFPREGYIVFRENEKLRNASCQHNPVAPPLKDLEHNIGGYLMLVDAGPTHTFVSEAAKQAFVATILDAYKNGRFGPESPLSWNEEWAISRGTDSDDGEDAEDGVYVMSFAGPKEVSLSVSECLQTMIDKGIEKFHKKWADIHVLTFESASPMITAERVTTAMQGFQKSELQPLDLILLIDDEVTTPIHNKT